MKIYSIKYIVKAATAFLLLFGLCFSFSSCEVSTKQNLEDRNYQLVWSDDFDAEEGQGLDLAKWTHDIGTGQNGWGNNELQYYTDRPENVSHDGKGNLVITAKRETFEGRGYTSARIKTQGLFSQQYGRFEARLKTPYSQGLWPAFWLLGSNITEVSWPQCGEIDIMELRGQQPNISHGTIHGPGYSGANGVSKSFVLQDSRFDTEFHEFAIEWGEGFIEYFIDGYLYQRTTPEDVSGEWVFDNDFFIILNVAVGGNYVGFPNEQSVFDQTMVIDYVRVYK